MKTATLLLILLAVTTGIRAQDIEINRLIEGELKMTFPSIYFKHKSTDYAPMPYTVDSSFKYIASYIDDISDMVMWRDSSESMLLTHERIKKIKTDLNKYTPTTAITIETIGNGQKISQRTINKGRNAIETEYLLSLNSAFDIARTNDPIIKEWNKGNHKLYPKLWCWACWKAGFHIKYRRTMRAIKKRNKKRS